MIDVRSIDLSLSPPSLRHFPGTALRSSKSVVASCQKLAAGGASSRAPPALIFNVRRWMGNHCFAKICQLPELHAEEQHKALALARLEKQCCGGPPENARALKRCAAKAATGAHCSSASEAKFNYNTNSTTFRSI